MRILRIPEVIARTGLTRTRIYILEERGEFPARRRIAERAVGWIEDEVDEWIAARPLARDVRPDAAADLPARGFNRPAA